MASRGRNDEDGNPEMIIVYGILSLCWWVIGFVVGLSV